MPLAPRVGTVRQVQRRRPPQKVETDFATKITDEELRRAIVSARALQNGTPVAGGTAAAPRTVTDIRHRVHRWTVLSNRPNHETAAHTMERCVRVLQPLMIVLRTATLSVEEFFPRNERLLGLNTNSGQRIQVRLRPAARPGAFLPLESVLHTLAHEVTHNFISPHNRAFFELHERITSLCERLIALGAMDIPGSMPAAFPMPLPLTAEIPPGDVFSGTGRTLGGGETSGVRGPPVPASASSQGHTPASTKAPGKSGKFPGMGRVAADGPTGTSAGPLAAAIRRRARSGAAGGAPDYETMRGQMLRAVLLRLAAAERAEAERHLAAAAANRAPAGPGDVDDDDAAAATAAEDVAPVCTCGTSCIDVDAVCADGDECSAVDDNDDAYNFWAEVSPPFGDDVEMAVAGADCGDQPGPALPNVAVTATIAVSPVVGTAVPPRETCVAGTPVGRKESPITKVNCEGEFAVTGCCPSVEMDDVIVID